MKIEKVVVVDGTFNEMEKVIKESIETGFILLCKNYIPAIYKGCTVNTYIAILIKEISIEEVNT